MKNQLSSVVDKTNVLMHTVAWPSQCKNKEEWANTKECEQYLDTMTRQLSSQLKTAIDVALTTTPEEEPFALRCEQFAYKACLEHLSIALEERADNLVGCSKTLDKIKEIVKGTGKKGLWDLLSTKMRIYFRSIGLRQCEGVWRQNGVD